MILPGYNAGHDFTRGTQRAERPESVHRYGQGPAVGLSDAGHEPVEFASAGVSADRSHRLRQVSLLRGRVHTRALAIGRVGLLLDDRRVQLQVDALLDSGALIVAQVDRARQFDEAGIKALLRLVPADPREAKTKRLT